MSRFDHSDLDGHLLTLLVAVVEERSVTRAAQRLGVSQSAVSHLLDKLRAIVGDPLVVRSGRGIVPTARAELLADRARPLLDDLRGFVSAGGFDPARLRGPVVVAANDLQRDLLMPGLLRQLQAAAPGASLQVIPSGVPGAELLRDAQCQLLLTPRPPAAADLVQKRLFTDRYAVFYDPACPSDLRQIGGAAALVSLTGDGDSLVRLQFIPRDFLASGDVGDSAANTNSASRSSRGGAGRASAQSSDDLDEATKRMGFERWLRQTVCKLHSSLDRDHLLQALADSLGRMFKATRCLVIRTDGPSHPMVTHEYVEPDLSPLGLGRTGQFPMFALSLFQQKTVAVNEVEQLRKSGQLSESDADVLLESGIRAMAGAPLSHQGTQYGVVILVVGDHSRAWSEADLETIELTAAQASIALSHCQTYHQVKDQLFHMNLLGNLTQQLTNALEVAAKAPAPKVISRADERASQEESPPLSSREMEVLKLIASGFANKEIAQRLFLTESTVELHASRIRKKLNLKSRTALVKYACDNDLV